MDFVGLALKPCAGGFGVEGIDSPEVVGDGSGSGEFGVGGVGIFGGFEVDGVATSPGVGADDFGVGDFAVGHVSGFSDGFVGEAVPGSAVGVVFEAGAGGGGDVFGRGGHLGGLRSVNGWGLVEDAFDATSGEEGDAGEGGIEVEGGELGDESSGGGALGGDFEFPGGEGVAEVVVAVF